MSEEIRITTALDGFADAVRNEIAAGSEILGGWIQHVQQQAQGEKLFELECWVRGLRAFFEPAHLPLLPEEKQAIVDRSFARECRVAARVFLACEALAAEVARVGQPDKVELEGFVEGALRRERTLDHHLDRILEQASPLDSLSHLVESLADLRVLAGSGGACGLDRFLGLGRTFRKVVSGCRYIDILLTQQFRPQTDRVDSPVLAAAIRAVREPVLRRHLTVLLLHTFRLLRYLRVLQDQLALDRPLSSTLVLFALLDEECSNLGLSLGSATLRNRLSTQRLKSAIDLAHHSLKATRSRVMEQELPGSLSLDIPGEYARVENSCGLLRHCLQTIVVGIAQALDRSIQPRAIFPGMKERQASAQKLKQDLWSLLQSVRSALEHKGPSDLNVLLDRLNAFRATSMKDLMYRDWAQFERFSDALVTAADPQETRLQLRELSSYLDGLIAAVAQRGVQKEPSVDDADPAGDREEADVPRSGKIDDAMEKSWKRVLLWSSLGSVVMGAVVAVSRGSSKAPARHLNCQRIPDGSRRVSLWTEQFEVTEAGLCSRAQDHYLLQKTGFRVWNVLDLKSGPDSEAGEGAVVYHVTHSRLLVGLEAHRVLEVTKPLERFYGTVSVSEGTGPTRRDQVARGGFLRIARCRVGGSPNGVETGEFHQSLRPVLHYRFDYADGPVPVYPTGDAGEDGEHQARG